MLEWGPTWKLGTKMAKAMHPWPSGGHNSWTRAPLAWIVDVFSMERGGHVPAPTRKRLLRRVTLDDWAPFDEEAIPIPKHHRSCMPEDPDEDDVIRAANCEEVEEDEDEGDEDDDDGGQREKKKQADSQDEPESEHSDEDEGDSAPLRQALDSAALKRKRVSISRPKAKRQKQGRSIRSR